MELTAPEDTVLSLLEDERQLLGFDARFFEVRQDLSRAVIEAEKTFFPGRDQDRKPGIPKKFHQEQLKVLVKVLLRKGRIEIKDPAVDLLQGKAVHAFFDRMEIRCP